jgi:tetratricopeptide (TPR) repeat protein
MLSWFVVAMPLGAFAADQYWAYDYQGMEVTAVGSAELARTIAHNLHRLDRALGSVLQTSGNGWRPPTLIYAVPSRTFELLHGKKDGTTTLYNSSAFENNILIDASSNSDNRLWGVYFGFAGSILNSAYSFRYPGWFVQGLSEVFAGTTINHFTVTIGDVNRPRVAALLHHSLIPLRTLLALRGDEPQFSSEDFKNLYEAQVWLLVHQIIIERQYNANFMQYFQRLDQGESEAQAFAQSFTVPYEELDKMLARALQSGKVSIYKVELQDEKDESAPRRLTDAEANGRLAMYAAQHTPQPEAALNLSTQSLSADPHGADAQMARILALLKQADYAAAFHSSEALCAGEALPQRVAAECGHSFARLAAAVAAKQVALEVDDVRLAQRAEQYFEKALAENGEDLAAWYQLMDLVAQRRDREYAKELLPRAERVQAAHPRMGVLARSVAGLCAVTGDYPSAIGYATVWQRSAISSQDRATASSYLSTLRTNLERRTPASGPTSN